MVAATSLLAAAAAAAAAESRAADWTSAWRFDSAWRVAAALRASCGEMRLVVGGTRRRLARQQVAAGEADEWVADGGALARRRQLVVGLEGLEGQRGGAGLWG